MYTHLRRNQVPQNKGKSQQQNPNTISREVLAVVFADVHVIKVSCIVFSDLYHRRGGINGRETVPQACPYCSQPFVGYNVRCDTSTWLAGNQPWISKDALILEHTSRNDIVAHQTNEKLVQLLAWNRFVEIQSIGFEIGIQRTNLGLQARVLFKLLHLFQQTSARRASDMT